MSDNLGNNSTVDRCGTGTEDMEMTLAEVGIADINNIAVWKRLTGYIRKNLLFLGEPLSIRMRILRNNMAIKIKDQQRVKDMA